MGKYLIAYNRLRIPRNQLANGRAYGWRGYLIPWLSCVIVLLLTGCSTARKLSGNQVGITMSIYITQEEWRKAYERLQ